MLNRELYNEWSATYDTVENKTRDLEKSACRQMLSAISFETVIEIGGGTGKNTIWLAEMAREVTAIDLSEEMQAVAKEKMAGGNVNFQQADVSKVWNFASDTVDLITCSLILEHVADLYFVFEQASKHLNAEGHFYVGELHPFRQYTGSKARFETAEGLKTLECFTHHVSDYAQAAEKNYLSLVQLNEWFDNDDRTRIPRLISFLFKNN